MGSGTYLTITRKLNFSGQSSPRFLHKFMHVLSLNFIVSVLWMWECGQCLWGNASARVEAGQRVESGGSGKDEWNKGMRRKGRKKETLYSLISCQPPARAAENEFSCQQLMAYNINIAPLYAGSEATARTRDQLTLVNLGAPPFHRTA